MGDSNAGTLTRLPEVVVTAGAPDSRRTSPSDVIGCGRTSPRRRAALTRARTPTTYCWRAADCRDCETREGKIDQIDREIAFAGPLTDEQRSRLVEISPRGGWPRR